jgi:hypothetical protein
MPLSTTLCGTMPMTDAKLVEKFFDPYERCVESFDEINESLTGVFQGRIASGRRFAWRGAKDATWGLHSSLYRRLHWTTAAASAPDERALAAEEAKVLVATHRWGLHNGERGRLSVLEQLATLQHFGAPTRLVDVSLNAYIGLWFAVEQQYRNGIAVPDVDGRLFAIDITARLINEDDHRREWEDSYARPWADFGTGVDWCGATWAWEPPAFEARIASQRGAFLFSGVPRTGVGLQWPKRPGEDRWPIDQVRRCTSLALRFHRIDAEGGPGRPGEQPAFTFRIPAAAKPEIRARLRDLFGYDHSTIYRDYPGFAQFGAPNLKSAP